MLWLKGMEPHIYGQKSQQDPWRARGYPWGLCGEFSWVWLTAQPRIGIWVCLIPASGKSYPKWSVGVSSSSSSSLYLGCDFFSHPIWGCKFYFSPILDHFFSLIPSLGHNIAANSTFSCHVSCSPIVDYSCDSGAAVGHDLIVFHFSAVLVSGLALSYDFGFSSIWGCKFNSGTILGCYFSFNLVSGHNVYPSPCSEG